MNTPKPSTPSDVCSATRYIEPLSHDDITTMLACFAAMVKKPSALSDKCTRVIVDALDDLIGDIDGDRLDQLAQEMWADTNRRAYSFMRAAA